MRVDVLQHALLESEGHLGQDGLVSASLLVYLPLEMLAHLSAKGSSRVKGALGLTQGQVDEQARLGLTLKMALSALAYSSTWPWKCLRT